MGADVEQHSSRGRSSTARWLIPALLVLGWLALGAVGGPYAGKLAQVAENDRSAFLPSSAESTRVLKLQPEFTDTSSVPAIIVAERAGGITRTDVSYLTQQVERVSGLDAVAGEVSPPIPAPDGKALQVVVPIDGAVEPGVVVDEIRSLLEQGRPEGLRVLVTGPAAQAADLGEAFSGIDGLLLLVAGSVVALILVIVYRSPILPVVVLLSAVFALGLASFAVYQLASYDVLALNGQSQGILFILVFGAATDYALLLVSRFREELCDTADRFSAMRRAWRATIEPIVASAGTVVLGVLCLLFSELKSNQSLGPIAAIGIVASLLAATTFLPAALVLIGRSAFWPFRPTTGSSHPEDAGFWAAVSVFVDRAPRKVWLATVGVLLVGAAFLPQFDADGTPSSAVFLTQVESVEGQSVLAAHYPAGVGAPAVVIADAGSADAVSRAARQVPGVADVRITSGPDGEPRTVDGRVRIEAELAALTSSQDALETVRDLRDAVHAVAGAEALVGGRTAIQLDTIDTAQRDLRVIIPIVLAVVLVMLALLLRALLAPLLLVATVVLSFAATLGVSGLVFEHVFGFPGADPVVPLFGFVFLVALGIDYNIFLMTRVREEAGRRGTREGTTRGLAVTGGVITSAGVVLAATFATLAVIPLLFLAQIAFIVAFGVLLDALIVRSLLVPALAIDIGDRIWWPSRLARRAGRHTTAEHGHIGADARQ